MPAPSKPAHRVLICGSRGWSDAGLVEQVVNRLPDRCQVTVGGARGADTLAEHAARAAGHIVVVMHADWRERGKQAGPIRNLAMLDMGPDLVIAFWVGASPGTRHTVGEAMRRKIPVEIHWRPTA